jgi:hypothetical protein
MTALTPYIIGLTPLLLAITGLAILPVGFHYADKERVEREARLAAEALLRPVTITTGLFYPGAFILPTIYPSRVYETGGFMISLVAPEGNQPQQPQKAPAARPRQPIGSLAEAA